MAEWKKIIVSGSIAELAAVTASARTPFVIGKTNQVNGETSTIPLVWDGTTGRVGTGSAYAVQGGTDYVDGSGLDVNFAIVGAGGSSIKKVDDSVSFATNAITDVTTLSATNIIASNTYATNQMTVTGSLKLGSSAANANDLVYINLIKPTLINGSANNHVLTSSTDIMFDGQSTAQTPTLQFQAGTNEAGALKDRIIFNTAAGNQQQYSIQTSDQGGDYELAEFKILNSDTATIHARNANVGIGGAYAANAGLKVYGAISGSGRLVVAGVDDASANLTTFDKTLVYDANTGTFGYAPTNTVGGLTGIIEGNNINTLADGTQIQVNVDAFPVFDGASINGTLSGSNLVVSGSGATVVAANQITASNLLVEDAAIFEGTFLFSGIDFTVQNASTFSGSNQFGSGSLPSDVFHEFTGSVDITGSLSVDGGFTIDDLTVTGNTILGDDSAEDTVSINADVTLFGGSTLDVRDSVTLGEANDDTLTVNAVSTFNENVTLNTANLNVGGNITGSNLQLTSLTTLDPSATTKFLIRSSSGDVFDAASVTLDDISVTAGPGISINGQVISADSSSMINFFRSSSLENVTGDVTFASANGTDFTSAITANAVVATDIAFINDSTNGDTSGDLLIAQGDGTFLHKSLSGVISVDADGVTSYGGGGGVAPVAGEAEQIQIDQAAAAEHSILLTAQTAGPATQSVVVDNNSSDFSYNTDTNVLTVNGTTIGSDVSIAGNLTVAGTTVTMNTEALLVEDNFIGLNSNYIAGGADQNTAPTEDAGIQVGRGTQTDMVFAWSEAYERWMIGYENLSDSATNFSEANASSFIVTMDVDTSIPGTNAPNFGATSYRRGQMRVDTQKDIWIYID